MISQTFLSERDMRLSWSSHAGGGLPAAVLGYWIQALLSECQQTLPSSKLMVPQGEPTKTSQYILSLSLLTQAAQQIWKLGFKCHSRKAEMEQHLTLHQLLLLPWWASVHSKAEGAGRRTWRGITVPSLLLEATRVGGSGEQAGLGWAAPNAVCHLG